MKRTGSRPTSSTTSRSVTKVPARFDMRTGSPARNSFTSWHTLMSRLGLAVRERRDGGLHARDVAGVIGAEHVDEVQEAARQLVVVIGHVGGEIGVAAVRLHQRAVDVVAEGGRPEQRLLAVLPFAVVVALGLRRAGPRTPAPLPAAPRWWAHLVLAPAVSERSEKNTSCVMLSAARSSLIMHQHRRNGGLAHQRQPALLGDS